MKKFLIYSIIFLSIFVGTATCVIFNGYNNYVQNQESISESESLIKESAISSLATNVMNSENYSGEIVISDNNNSTYLTGNFAYCNQGSIAVYLNLNGTIGSAPITAELTYLNGEVFLTLCGQKAYVSSTDLTTAINTLLASINTTTNSNLPKLDMAYAESLLSDIKTTPYGNGYLLQLSLPNICDCIIKTDANYLPTQILVTNLSLAGNTYTINITATPTHKDIAPLDKTDYWNASNILGYLPYAINTLTQNNLSVSGIINLGDTPVKITAYFGNKNMIIGSLSLNQLTADFQLSDGYLVVDLYGTTFKLSYSEVLDLINQYFPSANTNELSIDQLLNSIGISAVVENNKIVAINASVENIDISLEIGTTLIIPKPINSSNTLSKQALTTTIESFKNIISTTYSIDVTASLNALTLSGNAYIELNETFNGLNTLYFEGKLNGYELLLVHSINGETYLRFAENRIKLQNTSLEKTLEILFSLTGTETSSFDINSLDLENILKSLTLSGRKISLNMDEISATITSNQTSYRFTASTKAGYINGTLFPSEKSYSRIKNKLNPSEYKSYSELPSLLTAITNTAKKSNLHYSGNIDISILYMATYKNIAVDILYDKNLNKTQIVLNNLPTDSVLTYLSDAYYYNHTCTITIQHDSISIYSTAKLKLTNRPLELANKTLNIADFKIDNLKDILCMRESIVNLIKDNISGETPDIISNLTTDCIDVLKHNTLINLKNFVPDVVTHLLVEFYYDTEITKATLHCNVNSILFVNMVLEER